MKNYTVYTSDMMGTDLAVIDDDGNKIENITDLTIRMSIGEPIRVELEILGTAINVSGVVSSVNFICPSCSDVVNHDCGPMTLGGT